MAEESLLERVRAAHEMLAEQSANQENMVVLPLGLTQALLDDNERLSAEIGKLTSRTSLNRSNVRNLLVSGQFTPRQMLIELDNLVDDIDSIALCFRWKDGAYQCAWTTMEKEQVMTAYMVGVDKVMGGLRGERRIEDFSEEDDT